MTRRTSPLVRTFLFLLLTGCRRPIAPGDPVAGLSRAERARFDSGKIVFDSIFTPETGLGPLFNATECGECHEDPVAGGTGDEVEIHATRYVGGLCDPLAAEGGNVFQIAATPALQAALGIDHETVPPSATGLGRRTIPVLFGRGLLDAVPDSVILSYADPDDRNGDGISGRPNRFLDGRLGRFGRKAFTPTLDEFNAGAFVAEQGVTNPDVPSEETIGGRPIPPGVDPAPEPEISAEALARANDFVRFLAVPTEAHHGTQERRGRAVFEHLGCTACHIPELATGNAASSPALRHRRFAAYTDLLLHDMGPTLADICLGDATPAEFRTEPLVGLRVRTTFLHDGRATTIEQAIDLHGGEAERSRDRFRTLTAEERADLLAFLDAL